MDYILDEDFNVADKQIVLERENHRIILDRTKDYIELTILSPETYINEEGEEIVDIKEETRYATYYGYCEENELLDNFDVFWANSWLPQETLLKDDYEVTVNRIHNEIVLVKRLHKAMPMNLEEESVQEPQYEYDYRYLPIYEVTANDVMDSFEDFWSLEPLMTLDEPVVVGEVDYSIAGQVLKDGLDLGEGYENLANKYVGHSVGVVYSYSEGVYTITPITTEGNRFVIPFSKGETGASYTIDYEVIEGYEQFNRIVLNMLPSKILYEKKGTFTAKCTDRSDNIYINVNKAESLTPVKIKLQITKTSNTKPFIKNSRPDSKLALPQLAELGGLKSTEMVDNTLVAKHEQGTVIIKDAKVDANMPDESIQAMLLPTSDNRLMFKSDPRNPVKLKTYMDKTLDECIVEETSDYVLYNDNPNGQPTFACRYDKNTKEIYVGDGYENLYKGDNIVSNGNFCTWSMDSNGIIDINTTAGTTNAVFGFRMASLKRGCRYIFNIEVVECTENSLGFVISNVITENTASKTLIKNQKEFYVIDTRFEFTGTYAFYLKNIRVDSLGSAKIKVNLIEVSISTPKPFVSSYCPTGRIELDKLENIAIKEPVEKDTSNDPLPSLEFGLEAYRNDGKWRLYCATREKYPVGWENIKYEDDPSGASIFYDVSKTSTANNISGMITVDGEVYIGEGYENINRPANGTNVSYVTVEDNIYEFKVKAVAGTQYGRLHNTATEIGATYTISYKMIDCPPNTRITLANTSFDNETTSTEKEGSLTSVCTKIASNGINIYFPSNSEVGTTLKIEYQITKTSTPKPFTTGIVPNGSLKIACDENKSIITKGNKKNTMNSTVFYVYDNKRYEGINNSAYDFSETINSKAFTGAYEGNSYKTILRVNADSSFNGFFRVGALAGNWNCEYVSQILIYNNPNLTRAQMEAELAKDIKLHTYKFPINRVNPKFLAGLQPVKDDNGYNKLYFRSEDGQYPLGWDNMTYWEEENGVFTDLPNPNL